MDGIPHDAKIIYIKGDDNTVADALSRLPHNSTSEEAEQSTRHPYSYCDDNELLEVIASIWNADYSGPFESATALTSLPDPISINATLNISADHHLLQEIKAGYADSVRRSSLLDWKKDRNRTEPNRKRPDHQLRLHKF